MSRPAEPSRVAGGPWRTTVAVLVATFLTRSAQNASEVLFPLLAKRGLRMGPDGVGVEVAAYGLVSVLATLAAARAGSARRLHAALVIGLAALTASSWLFWAGRSVPVFTAGVLVGGLGAGLVFPALITLAGLTGPDGPEKSVTRYTVALSVALFVGPLAESAVLAGTNQNLRTALLVTALPTLAGIGVIAYLARRDRALRLERGVGVPAAVSGEPAVVAHDDAPPEDGGGPARRALIGAIWTQLMYEIPFIAVVSFGGLLATTVDHVSTTTVTLLFVAFFGVSIVWRVGLTRRAPLRAKRLLVVVAVVVSLAGTAVLVADGLPGLVIGMALLGVGHGITYPLSLAMVADATPRSLLGAANARLTAIVNLTSVALPLVIGGVARLEGYRVAFIVLLVPIAVCSVPAVRRIPAARPRAEVTGRGA